MRTPILHIKDYYAVYDLIESTLRMNMVMLAKPLLKTRDTITTFAQLQELTDALIAEFSNWGKYSPSSLHDTPNLASSDVVDLLVNPDAPSMTDVPDTYYKKIREDQMTDSVVFEEEELVMVDTTEEVRVKEAEIETYKNYLRGRKYS